MTTAAAREKVIEAIRQFVVSSFLFGKDPEGLRNDDSFLERGIIDSTGILEMIEFLEERFRIKVADEELLPENLDSINRVAEFVGRKTAA